MTCAARCLADRGSGVGGDDVLGLGQDAPLEFQVLEQLQTTLGDERAHLVMSDMAPNISGMKGVDQPRAMYLAELALDLCKDLLRPGGDFVCKLFQGAGIDPFISEARAAFERVRVMKPRASRPGSREVYLVARNYRL